MNKNEGKVHTMVRQVLSEALRAHFDCFRVGFQLDDSGISVTGKFGDKGVVLKWGCARMRTVDDLLFEAARAVFSFERDEASGSLKVPRAVLDWLKQRLLLCVFIDGKARMTFHSDSVLVTHPTVGFQHLSWYEWRNTFCRSGSRARNCLVEHIYEHHHMYVEKKETAAEFILRKGVDNLSIGETERLSGCGAVEGAEFDLITLCARAKGVSAKHTKLLFWNEAGAVIKYCVRDENDGPVYDCTWAQLKSAAKTESESDYVYSFESVAMFPAYVPQSTTEGARSGCIHAKVNFVRVRADFPTNTSAMTALVDFAKMCNDPFRTLLHNAWGGFNPIADKFTALNDTQIEWVHERFENRSYLWANLLAHYKKLENVRENWPYYKYHYLLGFASAFGYKPESDGKAWCAEKNEAYTFGVRQALKEYGEFTENAKVTMESILLKTYVTPEKQHAHKFRVEFGVSSGRSCEFFLLPQNPKLDGPMHKGFTWASVLESVKEKCTPGEAEYVEGFRDFFERGEPSKTSVNCSLGFEQAQRVDKDLDGTPEIPKTLYGERVSGTERTKNDDKVESPKRKRVEWWEESGTERIKALVPPVKALKQTRNTNMQMPHEWLEDLMPDIFKQLCPAHFYQFPVFAEAVHSERLAMIEDVFSEEKGYNVSLVQGRVMISIKAQKKSKQ